MKAAKGKTGAGTGKGPKVTVEDIEALGGGPVLIEKGNGWSIYYTVKTATGKETVRRDPLYTHDRARAEAKLAKWQAARSPKTPNLPAVVDPKVEAKREQARSYYHNKKNGNGGDKILVDRTLMEAVMQSLSSNLQSTAATVRMLDAVLN